MNGPVRFSDSQRKLNWADQHIQDLQFRIRAFLQPNPYAFVEEQDPDTGQWYVRVKTSAVIDPDISLIAGDVLCHLKSALDYMLWSIIKERIAANPGDGSRRPSRTQAKRIGFGCQDANPLGAAETRLNYEARTGGQEAFLGQDTITLLHAEEAYQGGKGDVLWRLDALNNVNKHRFVIITGVELTTISLSPKMSEETVQKIRKWGLPDFAMDMIVNSGFGLVILTAPNQRVVLEDGATIFGPADFRFSQKYHYPDPTADVAINEPDVIDGVVPIIDLLREFHGAVRDTIDRFAALPNPVP